MASEAEKTHAEVMELSKQERARLLAVKKKIHAGKSQIIRMQHKEGKAKKAVVAAHATVKKAKVDMRRLEGQEETRTNREEQEVRAKAGKGISDAEDQAMDLLSARAKALGREKGGLRDQVQSIAAKETLTKSLCKKNMLVLKLKKQVIAAELELKYKDAPESLLRAMRRVDAQLKNEKDKLATSERLGKKYGGSERSIKRAGDEDVKRAKLISGEMKGQDLVQHSKLAELEQESKEYQAEHGNLGKDEAKLGKYRTKIRELETKHTKAKISARDSKNAELSTKKNMSEKLQKEKWKQMTGAASSRSTLLLLHKTLSERRNALEKDVIRLRAMAKMHAESKSELLHEFSKLSFEELHLEHEIKLLEDVKDKTSALHDDFLTRMAAIKKFGGAPWLEKHNVRTAIGKKSRHCVFGNLH